MENLLIFFDSEDVTIFQEEKQGYIPLKIKGELFYPLDRSAEDIMELSKYLKNVYSINDFEDFNLKLFVSNSDVEVISKYLDRYFEKAKYSFIDIRIFQAYAEAIGLKKKMVKKPKNEQPVLRNDIISNWLKCEEQIKRSFISIDAKELQTSTKNAEFKFAFKNGSKIIKKKEFIGSIITKTKNGKRKIKKIYSEEKGYLFWLTTKKNAEEERTSLKNFVVKKSNYFIAVISEKNNECIDKLINYIKLNENLIGRKNDK